MVSRTGAGHPIKESHEQHRTKVHGIEGCVTTIVIGDKLHQEWAILQANSTVAASLDVMMSIPLT